MAGGEDASNYESLATIKVGRYEMEVRVPFGFAATLSEEDKSRVLEVLAADLEGPLADLDERYKRHIRSE